MGLKTSEDGKTRSSKEHPPSTNGNLNHGGTVGENGKRVCRFCPRRFPTAKARWRHEKGQHRTRRLVRRGQLRSKPLTAPIFSIPLQRGGKRTADVECHLCRVHIRCHTALPSIHACLRVHLHICPGVTCHRCIFCPLGFPTRDRRLLHIMTEHRDLLPPPDLYRAALGDDADREDITLGRIRQSIEAYEAAVLRRRAQARELKRIILTQMTEEEEREKEAKKELGNVHNSEEKRQETGEGGSAPENGEEEEEEALLLETPSKYEYYRQNGRMMVNVSCGVCGRRFSGVAKYTVTNFKRHVKAHETATTGVGLSHCRFCGKGFTYSHNRLFHERHLHQLAQLPDNVLKAAFGETFYRDSNALEEVTLGEIKEKLTRWYAAWSEQSVKLRNISDRPIVRWNNYRPKKVTNVSDEESSSENSESSSEDSEGSSNDSGSVVHAISSSSSSSSEERESSASDLESEDQDSETTTTDVTAQHHLGETSAPQRKKVSSPKVIQLPVLPDHLPPLKLPSPTATVSHQCPLCGRHFSFEATLALHQQKCIRQHLSKVPPSFGGKKERKEKKEEKAETVYICEDCEMEVSSRPKLNRHKKFYCPFRETIFADPYKEAIESRKQSLHKRPREGDRDGDQDDDDDGYEYVYIPTDSDDDDEEDNDPELLESLRVDFKRRRSGHHRLSRRILRKRLLAREKAAERAARRQSAPPDNTIHRIVSESTKSNKRRSKGVLCPVDNCGKVFVKESQWLAHMKRVHPMDYETLDKTEKP